MSMGHAEKLGAERGSHSLEAAALALEICSSGRSTRLAQRESGVPEKVIDRWVAHLGIRRTREETAALRKAALDASRVEANEVRRTIGSL